MSALWPLGGAFSIPGHGAALEADRMCASLAHAKIGPMPINV